MMLQKIGTVDTHCNVGNLSEIVVIGPQEKCCRAKYGPGR